MVEDDFDIFRTNLEANRWRSSNFQFIFAAIFPKGAKKGQPAGGKVMVPLFNQNKDKVRNDIIGILSGNSAAGVPEDLNEDIFQIVQLAGELSLEFGCQRTLLGVERPRRGDAVTIGQGYVDCQDGDSSRGKTEVVHLVVMPKFFRVGDGRSDLKMVKVICPGEIYPQ